MKIVISTAVYYPMINGVAMFSYNLARGLAKRGHQVLVLCPSQTGEHYSETIDGVKVVYLKSLDFKFYPDQIHSYSSKVSLFGHDFPRLIYKKGFRVSPFPSKEVKKVLKKFRPDIVHIQVSDPIGLSVFSYAKAHEIPIVTTEHNQPEVLVKPLHLPNFLQNPTEKLLSSYFYHRQSKSDFATMPTKQAIHHLLENKKQAFPIPIAAVSNGVDLSNFKPGQPNEKLFEKYHLKKNVPTALYVGRLDPEKKVNLVIEAFAKVVTKTPKAQLIIIGDGIDRPHLEKMVEDKKLTSSVRFLGRVLPPDLYELYRVGNLFITASEIETQGIVLIEAAATGLPLVAVDKGAVSEICRSNENGFLCEPQNVPEIAESIIKILSDKKLQLKFAKNSLKFAAEHDLERTLDQFINIYTKLLYDEV